MTLCRFELCENPSRAYGLCFGHIGQYRKGKELTPLRKKTPSHLVPKFCTFNGCTNLHDSNGLCSGHNHQKWKGKELAPLRKTSRAKGTGTLKEGYVIVVAKGHPNAQKSGRIFEHILVMSKKLGRPLLPGEKVHHKNGVRHDNSPENLELWVTIQPSGQRPEDLLIWAKEIISRYSAE